jgi:hypothetical protein
MKRTIATLGVLGLGLMGAAVSANAAPPENTGNAEDIGICLATGSASNPYVYQIIDVHALAAHIGDGSIVPENSGNAMPGGQNLTPANIVLLGNLCVAGPVVPPVVLPPVVVEPPAYPVVVTDVVVPPVVVPPVVVPPAVVPPAAVQPAVVPPAAVQPAVVPPAVVPKTAPRAVAPPVATTSVPAASNAGYNVQTAVGEKSGVGIPAWLAALTGLFTAVAALVLVNGGMRSRKASV